MKISNKMIIGFLNAIPGLEQLELPITLSYALRRNQKIFSESYTIYAGFLNEIFDRHSDHESPECLKEINELLEIEDELNVYMVDESILSKDFNISMKQLGIIDFMINKGE